MKKALSRILLRMAGWKIGPVGDEINKCVICVAPHTSNWDFVVGKLFYNAVGRNAKFLIKKEWFIFPFNLLFEGLGGVPVDRNQHTSITDQMVAEFEKRDEFHLAITPEGTRKRVEEWKKGFYYIALGAKVPIVIAYMDYGKKEIGFKSLFYPTGDAEKDIRHIREQYKGITAAHPENFVQL